MKIKNPKRLLVFLVPLLAVSLLTAGLLTYFGGIKQNIIVDQGLTIDGNDWDDWIVEGSVTMYSTEEKTITSANHQLQNAGNNDVVAKIVSVCRADETDNSCSNTETITLFKLSIPAAPANSVQDRVVADPNGITVDEITSLSFEYMLTETTTKYSPYFVLAFDTTDDGEADTWAVSLQDTASMADTWYTHGNGLVYHNVGTCTQSALCDLAGLKAQLVSSDILLEVKAMIGYWGDTTATTALVKNLEVNGKLLPEENGIIVPDDTFSDENGHVDFSIETYFPQMMKPATYTISTTAIPA